MLEQLEPSILVERRKNFRFISKLFFGVQHNDSLYRGLPIRYISDNGKCAIVSELKVLTNSSMLFQSRYTLKTPV